MLRDPLLKVKIMKPIILSLTAALMLSTPGFAQEAAMQPGAEFMTGWDSDANGSVTLDEANERRESIFAMFDADDNGMIEGDEYAMIDDHKAMEAENGHGPAKHGPQDGGRQGQGKGKGMGQGKGKHQGQAMGNETPFGGFEQDAVEGMKKLDTNGDGAISAAEFLGGTEAWFTMRDRNGDGVITSADFGPQN